MKPVEDFSDCLRDTVPGFLPKRIHDPLSATWRRRVAAMHRQYLNAVSVTPDCAALEAARRGLGIAPKRPVKRYLEVRRNPLFR